VRTVPELANHGHIEQADSPPARELVAALTTSARRAGRAAVVSGRWLGDTVIDMVPRMPLRDVETLSRHHDGATGVALGRAMVRSSARVSAAVGAGTGGLVALQELSIAGMVAIPFELAAETALVVLVELKLVAELHRVADRAFEGGPPQQAAAAVRSWLSGRAASTTSLSGGEGDVLGRATRVKLYGALRRRFARNLATLAPLLAGSAAAAWLNRRATLDVGRRVADDLGVWRERRR
jgi:hypothetical protein